MAALKYWVWLTALPGLSNRSRLLLLERYGSPEDVYYADTEELALTEGLTPGQAQLLSDKSLTRADRILADCARGDIFLLTMQDAAYPARLRDIFDPPVLLYGKGSLPLFDEEAAIAVVGTRSCTPYGLRCAHRMGYELARQGAVVVSGMAKGIDGAAMRGALQAGGFTAAVLGGGVDVVYPAENRRLYEDIAATGVLLSEYPPGTEPLPGHFPVRNRIISGLSLASLVVEAPVRSGGADHRPRRPGPGAGRVRRAGTHRRGGQRGLQPADPGRRGTGRVGLGHSVGVSQPVSSPAASGPDDRSRAGDAPSRRRTSPLPCPIRRGAGPKAASCRCWTWTATGRGLPTISWR